jgi:predicted HAD superfamily Cof-like phosphohydrolase
MKLQEIITAVASFHDAFGIENNQTPCSSLSAKDIELRFNLMKEENEEYLEAATNNDIVEIADALGDQLYILCGTILRHGLQHKIVEVFEEIQRSNMSKLDEFGMPIYREDGKVLKSNLYFKPDIKKILETNIGQD